MPMMTGFLPFVLLGMGNEAASAPPIRCEIQLTRWCIATFDGAITMTDESGNRVWTLQSRTDMSAGPLKIIESKECIAVGTPMPATPRLLYRSTEGGLSTEGYQVGDASCKLEFRWPVAGTADPTYRQTIEYGIIIDPETQPKQLRSAIH